MDPSSPVDGVRLEQLAAEVTRTELREDENTREQALEQFRDWVLKNPDIRDCYTDDSFLLKFLRARKFSVPMAEQTLVKFIRFMRIYPDFASNLDIMNRDIDDVITSGYSFVSPFRDSHGCLVHFIIAKNFDVKKYDYTVNLKSYLTSAFTAMQNEHSQIMGVNYVVDYGQTSPSFFLSLSPAAVFACVKSFEKAHPMRQKEINFVNLPAAATWFFKLVKSGLSEKMNERLNVYSSMEEFRQKIDLKVLPKEYGGTMPMEEMIGLWKKELMAKREALLALDNIKLVGDSFKNGLESSESGVPDIQGSFRKLEVD